MHDDIRIGDLNPELEDAPWRPQFKLLASSQKAEKNNWEKIEKEEREVIKSKGTIAKNESVITYSAIYFSFNIY